MFRIAAISAMAAICVACANTARRNEPATTKVDLRDFTEGLKTTTVRVNGQTLNMILDTGAGITVLTPQAAARVGCSVFARDSGFRNDGMRLDLDVCGPVQVELGSTSADLSRVGVGAFFGEPPPVDGMISLHALAKVPFELDLAHNELIVHDTPVDEAALRRDGWREIAIREGREVGGDSLSLFVGTLVGDHRLWMEFDSGSSEVTLLRPSAAKLLGLHESKGNATLALADGVSVQTDFEVREKLIYDGLIGDPLISKHRWLIDLAHSRAWVRDAK